MKKISEIREILENRKDRSAWDKGVTLYALDILADMDGDTVLRRPESTPTEDKTLLLNGADSWTQYSEGGCALIYDGDIAERTCSPSELKRTRNGDRNPNGRETWLDVQARALNQACSRILKTAK